MFWLSYALAFDQCPDPPRPHITDLSVRCEQSTLLLSAVVEDDGATVDQAVAEFWTPRGELVGTRELYLVDFDGTETRFQSDPQPFACDEAWLIRVVATNVLGQQGQRDRWLNSPTAVQNGGFEEDLWAWGVGGNAEVTWKEYQVAPLEPWKGNAMLELGWPENAQSVYGYAWQNLGEVPSGFYELEFQYAIATDRDALYGDGICDDNPTFFFGLNSYTDEDSMDVYESSQWNLQDHCEDLEVGKDGWAISGWMSESVIFNVSEFRSHDPTFLWFNSYNGYGQRAHWVYIDEIYLNRVSSEPEVLAASVLKEATFVGDSLSYPADGPDDPKWFYWDHFEDEINAVYQALCGDACVALEGKVGPEKSSTDDDVNGVWGFDGSMLHITDESVLLIETKTTAGTCFPNDETGEQDARDYIEKRRDASEEPLEKCGGEDCAQMSALWIEGSIKDLCDEEDDQSRLAATRIEEAWDAGNLYTTWAAVGFEPSGDEPCLTGWMLEAEVAPPKTRDDALCPGEWE